MTVEQILALEPALTEFLGVFDDCFGRNCGNISWHYYPGMEVAQKSIRRITAKLRDGDCLCPSSYPTPASCRMKPSRYCACAPYGVSSWATPSATSPNSWASATKPSVAGGRPTSPMACLPYPAV